MVKKSLYFRDVYWNTNEWNDLQGIGSKNMEWKDGHIKETRLTRLIIVEDGWWVHEDSLYAFILLEYTWNFS